LEWRRSRQQPAAERERNVKRWGRERRGSGHCVCVCERRERKGLGFFGKRPERKREKRAGSVYSHGTLNGTELEGRGGALPTWNTFGIWSVAVAVSCADCPRFEAHRSIVSFSLGCVCGFNTPYSSTDSYLVRFIRRRYIVSEFQLTCWFVDSSVPFILKTTIFSEEYPGCCEQWKRDEQNIRVKYNFTVESDLFYSAG
jgi:hypothetical protein